MELKKLQEDIDIEFQKLKDSNIQSSKLDKLLAKYQEYIKNKILDVSKVKKSVQINEEGLNEWLEHYWTWDKLPVIDNGKIIRYEVIISIPKAWNETVGYFWKSDKGYNKFKVNSVTNMLGLLPKYMREEIDFPEPFDIKLGGNGSYLTGSDIKEIATKYSEHIAKVSGDKAYLKVNSYYEIVKELIKNGTNPFSVNPIPKELFEKRKSNVVLRDYQRKSLEKLYKYSRTLILYPTGAGKTFPALEAFNNLKPPHIVFAGKYTTSVQQWKNRIKAYCPDLKESDVDIFTYQGGLTKAFDRDYTCGVYDEVHHITGKEWVNLTKINLKVVMGLTASPYNETEGADEMIVALTGIPDMPDWSYFYDKGIVKKPTCHIWLVKNDTERKNTLDKLLKKQMKTIVFCDSISEGDAISKKYNLPFVSGKTKAQDRLDIINNNLVTFVSRVFDESGSITDLERTIEYDYMGKSRTQELQRVGRGLHNQDKTKTPIHHIIMKFADFENDKGRLIVLSEKEFDVNWHYDQIEFNKASVRSETKKIRKVRNIVKVEKVVSKPLEIDVNIYPMTKNNRVKKIISMLPKGDVVALLPFLMRDKTQNGWTVRELMDEYGQLLSNNVNRKFKNIYKKGYIIKKGDRYVQNIVV